MFACTSLCSRCVNHVPISVTTNMLGSCCVKEVVMLLCGWSVMATPLGVSRRVDLQPCFGVTGYSIALGPDWLLGRNKCNWCFCLAPTIQVCIMRCVPSSPWAIERILISCSDCAATRHRSRNMCSVRVPP